MRARAKRRSFADYKRDAHTWITLATGEYYPDILKDAYELYKPVLVMFGQLLKSAESSRALFMAISDVPDGWMRVQLARVFRKYVSPEIPVEMLRRKTKAGETCHQFAPRFRPIQEVHTAYSGRPIPDEALCAILWEYRSRGQKGYDLTERLFGILRSNFPGLRVLGPERAGQDIRLGLLFKDYPNPKRPVDFVVCDGEDVLAIGLARYDSDRGGAQEDDRTGGYRGCADEILRYARGQGLKTKVVFVNDGPGLLLGSMWDDYAALEQGWPGKILVVTLRMVPERMTLEWLRR